MTRLVVVTFTVVAVLLLLAAADDSLVNDNRLESDDAENDERSLHHSKGSKHKGVSGVPILPPPRVVPPPVLPPPPVVPAGITVRQQQLSCPDQSTLIDNQCVITDIIPPDVACPLDLVMIDGECAEFSRGRRICPDGFRLSGSRCIVTEVVPAELMCEEGELDPSGGLCHIVGRQGLKCPRGFVMNPDQQCTQTFPADRSCPEGFVLHPDGHLLKGLGCVQELKAEASAVCPSGSQLDTDGRKCFSMKPNKPKCPKGYRMSHDASVCVQKVKKVLAPCPPGFKEFTKHKAVCERIVEIPPQLTCPQGSALNPILGQCEAELVLPGAGCLDGFVPSVTQPQFCERVLEMEGSCPPGTMAVGFGPSIRCQTSVEHELIECCPPGFDMMQRICERTQVFPLTRNCKGECESVIALKPELFCPEHFSLFGAECVRQSSHPCEEPVAIPDECVVGGSLRTTDEIPSACNAYAVPPPPCPLPGSVEPRVGCPSGILEGGFCIVRQPLLSPPVCSIGVFDPQSGQCIKVTRVPVKTECPDGTTRIGPRCVSYEEHPPLFACPLESAVGPNGVCVIRAPSVVAPPEIVRTAPAPICPSGAFQNGLCYDVERIPRQFVCPGTSVPASKHLRDAMLLLESVELGHYCVDITDFIIAPPQRRFLKPRYYCPDGNVARGKHCHSHNKVPVLTSCPPGSLVNGDLCNRVMPAVLTAGHVRTAIPAPFCPPGTVVDGMKCIATRELLVQQVCPPTFQIHVDGFGEKECVRFSPSVLVCPNGSRQTPDGCIVSRSVPPAVVVSDCEPELCF